MKRSVIRPRAAADLVEVSRWYADRGGASLGERFFDSARAAIRALERDPGIGSPRFGQLIGIDNLRSWRVARFPVRWFYFERSDVIDVVRLVGERQDIAAILAADFD